MRLAQMNVGRTKGLIDEPVMAGFKAELDRINALAERCPGFVWRFQDDSGHAMHARGFDDPRVALNLTVWEDAEALEFFVWKTVHAKVYARKAEWFEPMDEAHLVMWWVEDGHRPGIEEAVGRLEHLRRHGETDHAFGWAGAERAEAWRARRCA